METIPFPHGPEFQRSIIKTMLSESAFCSKAIHYLKEGYFSGELSWFFRKVAEFFKEHKVPPSEADFRAFLNYHGDSLSEEYKKQADLILKPSEINKDYLKKEVSYFIQANMFIGSVLQAQDLFNSHQRKECYDFVRQKVQEVLGADFENERVCRFGDAAALLEIVRAQSRDAIPTGIHILDDALQGGMMPQTWTTFLGSVSVGKSMLCPNLARAAYHFKKKKTFVMIHEDEEVPTKARYLTCFSGIPYNRLRQPKHTLSDEDNRKIKEADEILKEYVVLKFMYGKEAFVENVCDEARRMRDQWDYHLFLNDYPQCLKIRAFKQMDNTYAAHEFIHQELKQLCCELNIPGAGGAQTNRQGHRLNRSGSDLLRVTDVGDSWGTVKKSSNVITINRSDADKETNRIIFLLDKARNGDRFPVAVQCESQFGRCRTHVFEAENGATPQMEIPVTK